MDKWKCGKIDKDDESLFSPYFTRTNESPRSERGSEQLTFIRASRFRKRFHCSHDENTPQYVCDVVKKSLSNRRKCDEKPEMSSCQFNSLSHTHTHTRTFPFCSAEIFILFFFLYFLFVVLDFSCIFHALNT